jgi:hypothetical protein
MSDGIRSLLRRGDPLGDDPGLSPAESAHLKRSILGRVPEESPAAGRLPALVGGTLAALALGIVFFADLAPVIEAPPSRPVPGQEEAGTTSAPPPSTAAQLSTPPATSGAGASAVERAALQDPVRAARRIHFVTRGGTRVIWTLDPGFDL